MRSGKFHLLSVMRPSVPALLNYLAAAFAGCRHQAVEIAVKTLAPFLGPATAYLIGRKQ